MKKCNKCGIENQDEQQICSSCSEPLEDQQAVTEPGQQPEVEDNQQENQPKIEEHQQSHPEDGENQPVQAEEQQPDEAAVPAGKRKKIALAAGLIAAVAVVGIGAAVIGKQFAPKDPKQAVIDAIKSVNVKSKDTPMEQLFGFNELYQRSLTEKSEVGMSLKLEGIVDPTAAPFKGSGIEVTVKSDPASKQYLITYGVDYQNMDLAKADVYVDERTMMVAVPDFSDKVFSFNYAEDVAEQIENSPYLGGYVKESGVDINAVTEYFQYAFTLSDKDQAPFDIEQLWNRYREGSRAIEELKTAMTVEEGGKAAFTIDGKEQQCQGYTAVITKDALIQYLRTTSEFVLNDETLKADFVEYMDQMIRYAEGISGENIYGISDPEQEVWQEAEKGIDQILAALDRSLGDVTFTVYTDNKGRMASFDGAANWTTEAGDQFDIRLQADFKGGSYLTQNMDAVITLTDGKETAGCMITATGSYEGDLLTSDLLIKGIERIDGFQMTYHGSFDKGTNDYDITLAFEGQDTKVAVQLSGLVDRYEKGKVFEATADSITFSLDDVELVRLSGTYTMKPLEGEVTAPEGDIMDIWAATEQEWQSVMMEFALKAYSITNKLQ